MCLLNERAAGRVTMLSKGVRVAVWLRPIATNAGNKIGDDRGDSGHTYRLLARSNDASGPISAFAPRLSN